MSIKQLPSDVVAQIKSSVAVTSLNSVAVGLVKNSLDAQSSKINVSIDYPRGSCSVEDNGLGIAPAEFLQGGGLGKLHYTSKQPPDPAVYGGHGTFLASVAALSLISVTSHHHKHRSHNSLSIHNSKVLSRNTPAPPAQRLLTFPHGTRVTVRDLFGSMPVRVKQRAQEMAKTGAARDFEQLVLRIIGLLLFRSDKVSVVIRDSTSSNVLSLRTEELTQASNSRDDRKTSPLLDRTPRLLAQASLYEDFHPDRWVEVGAQGFGISIHGCVCLVPTATKRLQFIAIGLEPTLNEQSANVLHEEVNGVFANSAFGVIEGESDEDTPGKESRKSLRIRDLKARKGLDRWPIFALQIRFDDDPAKHTPRAEDVLDGCSPELAVITDLLRALAYQFLKKHHFRPKPVDSVLHNAPACERGEMVAAPPERRSPWSLNKSQLHLRLGTTRATGRSKSSSKGAPPGRRSESPFDAWSRVKMGRPLSAAKVIRPATVPLQQPKGPLMDSTGKLLRNTFEDQVPALTKCQPRLGGDTLRSGQRQDDETVLRSDTVWLDPVTKTRFTIDSRTGFVVETDTTIGKRVSLPLYSHAQAQTTPDTPAWIKEMQSEWKNPAYAEKEAPIPKFPDLADTAAQLTCGDVSNRCGHLKSGDVSETSMLQFAGRVSKQALREAEVIAQVDSKFILAKLSIHTAGSTVACGAETRSSGGGELLVLVDQHAADERCRVEALQNDYFASANGERGAKTKQLEKPIQFELFKQEGVLLARLRAHFEYWGIVYDVHAEISRTQRKQPPSKTKVEVRSLPPSILERCRLEPRLLIELLRKEAWKSRDETGLVVPASYKDANVNLDGEKDWVRRFHGCPQGILDLISSRACRSAVMFNDCLSKAECEDLVLRLADCVFPFQCAHGRPSMVPLVDLGSWTDFGSSPGLGQRRYAMV